MVDPLDNLTSSEQLRRLLLQEEQERIDKLEARLGSGDALKDSLVPIIADVLRDAGVSDYRRLADSLAPVVLQSIKTEIHNSRDMMVDALYPITGRLVAAAVRNAFKDLVDQLNSKLDSSLSLDRWRTRLKARMSGRSEAEVLLSEGAGFDIVDLLLINRQSGLLIAKVGPAEDQGGVDSHLLSSILTAIMSFVRDAMKESDEQDLRTLDVGDLRLHLQVSPGAILAVKTRGPPPAAFDTALNGTFYDILARWGKALSDPDAMESRDEIALTEDLDNRFQSLVAARQENFRKPSKKGTVLLGCLGLLAAVWFCWTFYDHWFGGQIEDTARTIIAGQETLRGYPIDVAFDHDSDALAVSGLLPDKASVEQLKAALGSVLPDTALAMRVATLPQPPSLLNDVLMQADLAQSQTTLRDEIIGAIEARTIGLSSELSRIKAALPTPEEVEEAAFRSWLDQQSLTFSNESDFDDNAEAESTLSELAERLSILQADIGLRIVGYGDDLGERSVSARVSRARALVVAENLIDLGIAPDRLQTVGRGNEKRIGDADGPGSVNRRVEFELIYRSEEELPNSAKGRRPDDTR